MPRRPQLLHETTNDELITMIEEAFRQQGMKTPYTAIRRMSKVQLIDVLLQVVLPPYWADEFRWIVHIPTQVRPYKV